MNTSWPGQSPVRIRTTVYNLLQNLGVKNSRTLELVIQRILCAIGPIEYGSIFHLFVEENQNLFIKSRVCYSCFKTFYFTRFIAKSLYSSFPSDGAGAKEYVLLTEVMNFTS